MNSSKENFIKTINHRQPDKVVVDFGSTAVTGIHVLIVEKLREYFGLEKMKSSGSILALRKSL
jgi:hypothetical protein